MDVGYQAQHSSHLRACRLHRHPGGDGGEPHLPHSVLSSISDPHLTFSLLQAELREFGNSCLSFSEFSVSRVWGTRGEFGLTEKHLALVAIFSVPGSGVDWDRLSAPCIPPPTPLLSAYDSELSGGCLRGAGAGAVRATQQLPCPQDRGRKHEGLAGSQGLTASPPPSIS